jgi:hypothetical protein
VVRAHDGQRHPLSTRQSWISKKKTQLMPVINSKCPLNLLSVGRGGRGVQVLEGSLLPRRRGGSQCQMLLANH